MPMTLRAFAYVSRATSKLSRAKLDQIVTEAVEFNGPHGLSGALAFDGTCFFQYIEGPAIRLAEARNRIYASKSHVILLTLVDGAVPSRRFAGWEMYFRDSAPAEIEGLNWAPGAEPQGESRSDVVANSLRYFWNTFSDHTLEPDHA